MAVRELIHDLRQQAVEDLTKVLLAEIEKSRQELKELFDMLVGYGKSNLDDMTLGHPWKWQPQMYQERILALSKAVAQISDLNEKLSACYGAVHYVLNKGEEE